MKNKALRIAVLSGKGGTGKTLVSVNLASVAEPSHYLDCDVEEPNGHLFFKPEPITEQEVTIRLPLLDESRCSACRTCVDFCKFNALAFLKNKPYVFSEVCHSCGGCMLLCPEKALSETEKGIGRIQTGASGNVTVITGMLNPGEASGVPIIKTLLAGDTGDDATPVVIDCPPGSACIVMESIKDADYCILVAEPTQFGAHNLMMVYELVKLFQKPHGVVLNKCLPGENPSETFCTEHNIPILCRIPFDRELGTLNAEGKIIVHESETYEALFSALYETVRKEVCHETAVNP